MTHLFAALRALDTARTLAVDTLAALGLLRRAWDALPALLELADEWAGQGEDRCDCCGGTVDEDSPPLPGHVPGDEDCPCGPTNVPVTTPSGAVNWVLVHRTLADDADPERQADRAVAVFEAMEIARKDDEP